MDTHVTETPDFDPDLADGTFHVTDREGKVHLMPGVEGYRLMEIMRDSGLPIAATCGGAAACGTCHVFVAPEWFGRLPEPQDDEAAKLDELVYVGPHSRLSCQIIWEKARLDGLDVTLAPEEE